eukprot:TRINITY_DN45749_c0_g2_i1.p1 TRINITY_DN45749_c0_g2~~TRINITY_DN45749_c0_g2_i1.p1  ORF type:complete len:112 (-),score=15.56 TRINITY_DN45749_c0_g2_i1:4-339(-)
MLKKYIYGFSMQFSTKEYTTGWINLEIGRAMGCAISSILFVLAIEAILKTTMTNTSPADLGNGYQMPPLKTFMDDTTVFSIKEDDTHKILRQLNKLVISSMMRFKPPCTLR